MATIDQVEEYVRRRDFTDYIMPVWLPFLPIIISLSSFLWFFIMVLIIYGDRRTYHFFEDYYTYNLEAEEEIIYGFLGIYLILAILALAINVYVVYKWVWRRNEHFKRQKLLFNAVKDFLRSKGLEVSRLEAICMEIDIEENEKNAVLWALVQFIPYVGGFLLIYVYHFLNKDFYKHERREEHFINALSATLSKVGIEFNYIRYSSIPDRSTILYFVLSLITLGFFGLYWVYTLTKDPNNHFMEHKRWEELMLSALKRL